MSKRIVWKDSEVIYMLTIMREKNILKLLDSKRFKSVELYGAVEQGMMEAGFNKTAAQIKIKWKNLKFLYTAVKKNNNTSGAEPRDCPYYEELDELLNMRPNSDGCPSAMEIVPQENYTGMYFVYLYSYLFWN